MEAKGGGGVGGADRGLEAWVVGGGGSGGGEVDGLAARYGQCCPVSWVELHTLLLLSVSRVIRRAAKLNLKPHTFQL